MHWNNRKRNQFNLVLTSVKLQALPSLPKKRLQILSLAPNKREKTATMETVSSNMKKYGTLYSFARSISFFLPSLSSMISPSLLSLKTRGPFISEKSIISVLSSKALSEREYERPSQRKLLSAGSMTFMCRGKNLIMPLLYLMKNLAPL